MKEIYEKSDIEIVNIGRIDIFNIATSSDETYTSEEESTTAKQKEVPQGEI